MKSAQQRSNIVTRYFSFSSSQAERFWIADMFKESMKRDGRPGGSCSNQEVESKQMKRQI